MLRARRRAGLIAAAAVLALSMGAAVLLPRTYTATAMLMVNYQVSDPSNGRELPTGQLASYIATQAELMHTRTMLVDVVERLGLTQHRSYALGYTAGEGTLAEWVAAKIATKLEIHPSATGSQLIYITFSASRPDVAAAVPNTIADIYSGQERLRESGAPEERARRTEGELATLKARVDSARTQLDDFERHNGLVGDDGKAGTEATTLENLEARLLEAQNARRMAELRQAGDGAGSDQAPGSALVQNTRSQLAAKEQQLAQMARVYGPAYPGLREVGQQVDDLRASLAQLSQSDAARTSSSVAAARELENRLARDVAAQRARLGSQDRQRAAESGLRLEYDSAQQAYRHALDAQGKDTASGAARGQGNAELVSRATPPLAATGPKTPLIVLGGLVAALLSGLGVPLALEYLDRRVRCRDDLERLHGIPVLAEFRLPAREGAR